MKDTQSHCTWIEVTGTEESNATYGPVPRSQLSLCDSHVTEPSDCLPPISPSNHTLITRLRRVSQRRSVEANINTRRGRRWDPLERMAAINALAVGEVSSPMFSSAIATCEGVRRSSQHREDSTSEWWSRQQRSPFLFFIFGGPIRSPPCLFRLRLRGCVEELLAPRGLGS